MRRLGGVSFVGVGKGFRSTAYPGMSASKSKSISRQITNLLNMPLHYTTTNCGSRKRPSSELLLPVGCKKMKNITTNMPGIKPANILSKLKNEIKPETSSNTCRGCHRIFFNRARLEQHKKDTGHRPKPNSRVHCSFGSTVPSHRQPLIILKRRSEETTHCSPEKIRRTRAKEYLNDFHKRKIAINNSSKKDSVKLVDGTLRQIMKHVKNSKGGNIYCQNLVRAGSFKEKTKIGKADEFDTNIVCNIIPDNIRTRGTVDFEYQPLGKMVIDSYCLK